VEDVVSEFDGWARTIVRCGDKCGGELGAVYDTAAGLLLMGSGIDGSRVLDDGAVDPIAGRCPKCGQEGTLDPIELYRAARARRRTYILR
jgi:hypothetical protein